MSVTPTSVSKPARAHGPGDLTMTAVILFALGAYGVAAGSVTGEERAVAVGVFAFTLFVTGIVWPIITLARVRISVTAPADATVGDIVPLRVTVTGHATRVEVRVLDPTGTWWRTSVPTQGVIPHEATRRGVFDHVRVQIRTSAPLGVFLRTRQARVALPTPISVAPRPLAVGVTIRPVPPRVEAPSEHSVRGAGSDAVRAVRPYVSGDPARLVHWPTSARRGDLAVREHDPPANEGLALVVDLTGTDARVEDAASRGAGIGGAVLARGGRLILATRERTGAVCTEVGDRRELGRRLARGRWTAGGTTARLVGATRLRRRRNAGARVNQDPDALDAVVDDVDAADDQRPSAPGSPWRPVAAVSAIALGAIGAAAAPRLGLPVAFGALAGGLAAVLAVLALPSFPTRRAAVLMLGIAGLGALRHAALPTTDSALIVCWALATIGALVLVDRADAERIAPLAEGRGLASRLPEAARAAAIIAVIVAVAAVAIVPSVTDQLGRKIWPGVLPSLDDAVSAPESLRASRELDMTTRPRLSERVVFTVDAPRPEFWRGEVFDTFDGQKWTRSDDRRQRLSRTGDTWQLFLDPDDPGALRGTETKQTFRIETGFSQLLFAAPSPVEVRSEQPLIGRPDGTAMVDGGFGKDAVYTVTSRSSLATEEDLRAAENEPVPSEVLNRYADEPDTTPRVRALAEQITEGADTTYDKIRAIEAWLARNTEYSLDAPLSPKGVDVVDFFLFESRLGWCEQVSSSLAVLARSAGIPARLATGFVPGEKDGLSGRFVVRERDAHAWTEIYFPGVGWQGFDPTAHVPLAGEAGTARSWMENARAHAFTVAIGLSALVWLVVYGPRTLASLRRRRARRRSWAIRSQSKLERLGRRAGRPRAPSETPREYARAVAETVGDPRLAGVGDVIDQETFAATGADPPARAAADAVLAEAGARKR